MVTMDFPDRIKTSFGLTGKLIGVSLYPINLNLISTFYSRSIYYLMVCHLMTFQFNQIKIIEANKILIIFYCRHFFDRIKHLVVIQSVTQNIVLKVSQTKARNSLTDFEQTKLLPANLLLVQIFKAKEEQRKEERRILKTVK